MSKLKHKIIRFGDRYQVQRMFITNGINPVWITKRMGYPDTPGVFVKYRFLNQAIKDIRAESRGKESFIILDNAAMEYLKTINFEVKDINLLVGNIEEEDDAPTAIS